MKKTIAEIVNYRAKERCYLIASKEGHFIVIHGSYCRDVLYGELYDSIMLFKRKEVDWKHIERRIRWDRDEEDSKRKKRKWSYIVDVKSRIVDIETLTIDGEAQKDE